MVITASNEVEWTGRIGKGSSAGAGWITVPAKLRGGLVLGEYYDLVIEAEGQEPVRLNKNLKRVKKSWGFFLPKRLCAEREWLGQRVRATVEKADYFPVKVSADKRVRIPAKVVEEHGVEQGELYEVELAVKGDVIREIVIITAIDRSDEPNRGDEYYFTVRMNDVARETKGGVKITRKVERMEPSGKVVTGETIHVPDLFPEAVLGKVDEEKMIIFKGNHVPVVTPINVNMEEIMLYFGHYHADGTKVGPGWSTGASTPEQAKYNISMYEKLIDNRRLEFGLTYTKKPSDKRNVDEIKSDLAKFWKRTAKTSLHPDRIRIIRSNSIETRNWNRNGSLRIRDYRSLVMETHLRILDEIYCYISTCNDVNHLWFFFFGILEGDGYVYGGKERIGVGCSTHIDYSQMITSILARLGVNYHIDKYNVDKGISSGIEVQFSLFEVLLNVDILSRHLFLYYPKRRKLFIKRLLKQPTVQYIMGKKQNLSSFARSFVEKNSLDTERIKKTLDKLETEIENST